MFHINQLNFGLKINDCEYIYIYIYIYIYMHSDAVIKKNVSRPLKKARSWFYDVFQAVNIFIRTAFCNWKLQNQLLNEVRAI